MYFVVLTTNLGEERAIGLIVNFSATLLICEIDDIMMNTARIQKYRESHDAQQKIEERWTE